MNTLESLKVKGKLTIVLRDKDGNVKDERSVDNLVVNTGLAYIASRMVGTTTGVMSHMALGSGTTAAAGAQTDLITTLGSREALDSTTITGANNTSVQYMASFEAGKSTGAVTEAGIFNDPSAGLMLCRTVFPVVNKGADDALTVTWTVTLSAI